MTSLSEQVHAFHVAMGVPVAERPTVIPEERVRLRAALIAEEFVETMAALFKPEMVDSVDIGIIAHIRSVLQFAVSHATVRVDMVELADGLADLDYVVEGTRLEFGIDGGPIAAEVHRSNMSKLVDGKPVRREDGKILKGPNFSPPDIAGELRRQGWKPT